MKVRTSVSLLTVAFCLASSPARTQDSPPIEIGVEVSPSAYALGITVPIKLSFCNTTPETVVTWDPCGRGCFFDLFVLNEAGEVVARKGLAGPAVLLPLTWGPYECWGFEIPWYQTEERLFDDDGTQVPAGIHRARLEFYSFPPTVQTAWSEPFLIGAPVTVVPTLSPAGLMALVLTLVGAAFAVLRSR